MLCARPADKCIPNVEQNLPEEVRSSRVRVETLLWGKDTDVSHLQPPFDILVAGDCVYEEACIVPLLETMQKLTDEHTQVYMCGIVGEHCLKVFNRVASQFCDIEDVDLTNVGEVQGRSRMDKGGEPTQRQMMKLTFTDSKRAAMAAARIEGQDSSNSAQQQAQVEAAETAEATA